MTISTPQASSSKLDSLVSRLFLRCISSIRSSGAITSRRGSSPILSMMHQTFLEIKLSTRLISSIRQYANYLRQWEIVQKSWHLVMAPSSESGHLCGRVPYSICISPSLVRSAPNTLRGRVRLLQAPSTRSTQDSPPLSSPQLRDKRDISTISASFLSQFSSLAL